MKFVNNSALSNDELAELITRRRRQILVHSVLYYKLNQPTISDHTFDKWSKELAELQSEYPEIAATCEKHDEFKDFDGSSGHDLPIHTTENVNRAYRVLNAFKFCTRGA